jgi:hypothetical protein
VKDWINTALERPILLRGAKVAAVVGPVLIIINYGDVLITGEVTGTLLVKMALTVCVPFCVSVYSSVSTVIRRRKQEGWS